MMPSDLPYGVTVYHYFRKWRKARLWQKSMTFCVNELEKRWDETNNPVLASSIVNLSKPVKKVEYVVTTVRKKSKDESDIYLLIPKA